MDFNSVLKVITVYAIPLIFAITVHEAAHAYAARYFGDSTAYMLGRMTLNPLKHIDPVWTIAVPLVMLLAAGFAFGAAKPVPVNFSALRNPKRDSIWVAAAGPGANLIMMIGWMVIFVLVRGMSGESAGVPLQFLGQVAEAGVLVNALLMVLNLLPILPLDGGRIVAGLLPNRLSYQYSRLEPYGMIFLVVLIVSPAFEMVVWPLVGATLKALYSVFGV